MNRYTRRGFVGALAAGSAGWAMPWPARTVWSAQGSDRGTVRIVFYTDIHARTEWDTPVAMRKAAEAINARNGDLVMAGGDLITDGFQSSAETVAPRWDAYMKMHRAIDGEIRPVIGNHDLVAAIPEDGTPAADNPRAIYLEKMGLERSWYAFEAVGYHFIVLDGIRVGMDGAKYKGFIGEEQQEWIREDLSRLKPETPIILATHIPLLTSFYAATRGAAEPPPQSRVVVNNVDILKLFEGRNLVLVLQGHLHVDELLRWRNTTFITGGAISAKWWRGPWHGTEEGFGVLTLREKQVEWEYVDYGWEARRPVGV